MIDDTIAKTLNLTPLTLSSTVNPNLSAQITNDFDYARGNIIAVIEKGQDALTGILEVASMSQHPRSFEVVATLIKAVSDANKDLLELQKRRKDLTGEQIIPTTVNNNLFVGSTAELQQLIKKHNE